MRNYLMEFIGTMFLVLTVGLSGDPIAIGIVLMVMVYMGQNTPIRLKIGQKCIRL